MMSTWSQSAPWSIVREQSWPSCAKSAERIDGAMIALGAIAAVFRESYERMDSYGWDERFMFVLAGAGQAVAHDLEAWKSKF